MKHAVRFFLWSLVHLLLIGSWQMGWGQTVFLLDFESAGGYTTSIGESTDNGGDYFLRTDGSDISATFFNIQGSSFFAAQDVDAAPTAGGATETLTITGINISGLTSLGFAVYLAEDDDGSNQDWDDNTSVIFQYRIDGGTWTNVLAVEAVGGTNTEPALDTDFDGIGDGAAITDAFTQYSAAISGGGSTLDIQVLMSNLDAGDEDIAFDNIEVTGTTASANTITTGTIIGSPFNVTAGAGAAVTVPFSLSGVFDGSNVFTAQLSDASGSFASPTDIGSQPGTTPGVVGATIPAGTPSGTGYRIRVVGSDPVTIGSDNGVDLEVVLQAAPAATTDAASGITATGAVLNGTVDDNNLATTINFRYGTTPGGPYPNSIAAAQSPLPAGSGSTAVTATLSGLTTGQAYYYVVEATNSAGTTTGSEESFTPVAGPSCFAFQGFEGTPGDNWTISNGAANISSVAGAGDTPSNQRIRTGNFSWLVNNGTGTLDLAPFSVSGITNVTVTVRLSSTSGTTGNGADGGDFVRVFADLDGGGFPATADVALEGFSNARYGYDATLTASTTAGTPISVAAPQGGTSTNNYATIEINIPDGTSTVGLRVTALNSDGNEFWNIDDIELCGVIASGPCVAPTAQPTALTLTPVGTDQLDGGFTAAGDADSYLIIRSLDGTLDSSPVDGTSYSAGQALTGDDVVEGFITGTTFSATGLSSGTQYHYFIIAANSIGCTGGPVYYLTSPLTGSAFTNPEGVASGDIDVLCTSPTEMTVTWTGPTSAFDGYLLVGRQGASPSAVNILDPQTATASTVFGAEEYVMITESSLLYIGTATSATITGLTPGLSYTFQIYTYVASQFSDEGNSGPTTSATAEVREVSGFSGVPVNQGANLSWANLPAGCFDEVLIVASTASVTATPTGDGSAYTADAAFGSGTAIVPGEFVVYQGTGTTTAVSGLTNGTPYFFKAFVRVGNFWSAGVEISVVPNDVTIFAPGDFMIVAVNTTALPSGGTDEVCFIAFQDITPGTIFEITDNGYERVTAGLWGDTEGVIRFERDATASTVPAGTPICLLGAGNTAGDFEVYVDGTLDADWIISSLNGIAQFNLNASDQVWFLQGGNWVNPGGSHDATYTGEVLYGWTGTGWEAAPGYASTSGSTLFPGLDCFVADLQSIPNFDKAKFTNPTPATLNSQRAWLTAAKDPANWTGSVDNATYNALTPDYRGTSNVFAITAGGLSGSDWIGDANDNWFDCGNWSALLVPEQGDAVTILTTSTNTARIDGTAPFASRYAGIALAGSLVIQTGQEVRMETDDAYLRVAGDLTIETGAALIADNGAGNTATIEVGGLWVDNEPTGGFDAGTGSTVIFNGSALQGISAVSSIAEFANIELDNPNGLDLGVPVGVIGDFNFVNGLVQTTSSLLLSFRDNATATGASDASHVNGPVEKAGDEAFVFPVGKGGQYRPIEMSAPALTTDTYRAEYFAGNGQAVFGTAKEVGIGFVSPLEYWQFDEISVAPATAVALTLNWNATSNIDPADVFAVRWDGSQWTQVGGAGAAGGITGSPFSGTVTSAAETDFSPVTFGSNGTSFPVELLDLQASLNAGAVTLDWLTASERNSSHFVVERSADRRAFQALGEVAAAGESVVPQAYAFVDDQPLAGLNYYRLRMVDLDGSFVYSPTIAISTGLEALQVQGAYPNPAEQTLNLLVSVPAAGEANLELIAPTGQVVRRQALSLDAGTQALPIHVGDLASGMYFYRLRHQGRAQSGKWVKQ